MPEGVSGEQAVTWASEGVQPPLIAIDGLPCFLEQVACGGAPLSGKPIDIELQDRGGG